MGNLRRALCTLTYAVLAIGQSLGPSHYQHASILPKRQFVPTKNPANSHRWKDPLNAWFRTLPGTILRQRVLSSGREASDKYPSDAPEHQRKITFPFEAFMQASISQKKTFISQLQRQAPWLKNAGVRFDSATIAPLLRCCDGASAKAKSKSVLLLGRCEYSHEPVNLLKESYTTPDPSQTVFIEPRPDFPTEPHTRTAIGYFQNAHIQKQVARLGEKFVNSRNFDKVLLEFLPKFTYGVLRDQDDHASEMLDFSASFRKFAERFVKPGGTLEILGFVPLKLKNAGAWGEFELESGPSKRLLLSSWLDELWSADLVGLLEEEMQFQHWALQSTIYRRRSSAQVSATKRPLLSVFPKNEAASDRLAKRTASGGPRSWNYCKGQRWNIQSHHHSFGWQRGSDSRARAWPRHYGGWQNAWKGGC